MRRTRLSRHRSAGFLTIEVLLSLGLATVAFGSFLAFYHSIAEQQAGLRRFAEATFLLQSTVEEARAGSFGQGLESLAWEPDGNGWRTADRATGRFEWKLTADARPVRGQLFPFKAVVTWRERGKQRHVVAATQLFLK